MIEYENPTVKACVQVAAGGENGEVYKTIEVEVLTVHFNTGKMRIRYYWEDYYGKGPKLYTTDIPIEPFLQKYKLTLVS